MDGNEERDKTIYEDLTEVLAALREVIIQNFQIDLPEARVVSMTTEMVESGFLEYCRDENGVLCIRPKEPLYDLRIKIIKTPDGPAPEEFRQKWIGFLLAARKLQAGYVLNPGYENGGYEVLKKDALGMFRVVSPEGADQLAEIFKDSQTLLFGLDEAEIVP
ncbi:hypothetical protein KJ665_00030 [Patescibacteria group bacterium]|nr:hypothetical protein [Patescibacteria group bacterium]